MPLDFPSLPQHIVPLANFRRKGRVADDELAKLPAQHLGMLQPLTDEAAQFLWDYVTETDLHGDTPFKKGFFRTVDKAKILADNEREIKKWLYQRGIPFDKLVYLSWQPTEAMIVPWKLLVKYFSIFCDGGSSDLTVFDQGLNWALLFYHEDEIYFGTNQDFEPSGAFPEIDFIW
jgi:hypothetical protein